MHYMSYTPSLCIIYSSSTGSNKMWVMHVLIQSFEIKIIDLFVSQMINKYAG